MIDDSKPQVSKHSRARLVLPFSFDKLQYAKLIRIADGLRFRADDDGKSELVWRAFNNSQGLHQSKEWADSAVQKYLGSGAGDDGASGMRSWEMSKSFCHETFVSAEKHPQLLGNLNWEYVVDDSTVIPLSVRKADNDPFVVLSLLSHGSGLISVDFALSTNDIADWLTFITHARLSGWAGGLRVFRKSKAEDGSFVNVCVWPDAFGAVPEGHDVAKDPYGMGAFSLLANLLDGLTEGAESSWWRPVLSQNLLMPFYALSIENVPEEKQALHRFHLSRLSTKPIENPPLKQLGEDADGIILLSRNSALLASIGGTGFLNFDMTSNYLKDQVLQHFRERAWCVFALAMQQRIVLQMLAERITAGYSTDNVKASFEDAKDDMMQFTAEARFFNISSQNLLLTEYYRLLAESFELSEINATLRTDIALVNDHLRYTIANKRTQLAEERKQLAETRATHDEKQAQLAEKRSKELERLIQFWGIPIAVLTLVIGVLGINIQTWTTNAEGLMWSTLLIIIAVTVSVGYFVAKMLSRGR